MDLFMQNFKALAFVVFPTFNLVALIAWRQSMYEPKAPGRNEKKRKHSNAIKLIISLIIANSMFLYLILRLIHG